MNEIIRFAVSRDQRLRNEEIRRFSPEEEAMSKLEGLDAAGIATWINGLDRPPPVQTKDSKDPDSRVEATSEASGDSSDLSQSGHAFARASERLKSVGYRHREGDPKDEQDPQSTAEETTDETMVDSNGELSATEEEQVRKLKESDTRVRAHEMAHKAAAGSLAAGGPYYDLQRGPDGQNYAVGGEVPIRLPETTDYKEAIKDAQQAERAALAPADPSPDDYAAAAAFRQRALEARAKLSNEERQPTSENADAAPNEKKSETQSDAENAQSSPDTSQASLSGPPLPSSFSTSAEVDLDSPS